VDLHLDPADRELRDRARTFSDRHLLPYELECEEQDGLSPESLRAIRQAAVAAGLNAPNHALADGGQGFDLLQQVLVEEQLGRATGGLWTLPGRPSLPLRAGTPAQRARYLGPACRGERHDAYAITEAQAGSDPRMVRTTAVRDGDGYRLSGEKWHVSDGDIADFLLVHAHVDGDPEQATLFLVDVDTPGVRVVRTPRYMHTYVFAHPIYAFDDVRLGREQVLGAVGQGLELTKDWFVEERLMIGARTVGAATRALELATAFARERRQFDATLIEFQGIEFMLADMAAELMAAQALCYRVAWQAARGGAGRRDLHGLTSAVKLVCSETAGRIADRAVQVFGGRGYMREQPVERLYRELRVDRIWEGTSEIQRLIVGNELRKRGPELFTTWPQPAGG